MFMRLPEYRTGDLTGFQSPAGQVRVIAEGQPLPVQGPRAAVFFQELSVGKNKITNGVDPYVKTDPGTGKQTTLLCGGPMIDTPLVTAEIEAGKEVAGGNRLAADFYRLKTFRARQFDRPGHAAARKVDQDHKLILRVPSQDADDLGRGRIGQPDHLTIVERGV